VPSLATGTTCKAKVTTTAALIVTIAGNSTRRGMGLTIPSGATPNTFGVGFIAWLGFLKSLAHYVAGPFVPNARPERSIPGVNTTPAGRA
jgi:hypothetical protein